MNFDERVNDSIREMINLGYTPKAFITMVIKDGAINAVKTVISKNNATDGFTKLWKLKRLDLSMKNIILENEWLDLFSDKERKMAKKCLKEYGYDIKK